MKKESRGGIPLAGLTVAAILLASTAGYVSALSRMFQAPVISQASENDFLFDGDMPTPPAKMPEAGFEQQLGQMAATWLVNALPGYSSGRARELWYLSLDSSGDRRLSIESSAVTNVPVSGTYAALNAGTFGNLTPTTAFVSSRSAAISAPAAPAATTGNIKDFTGGISGTNTSMLSNTNYTPAVLPTSADDVRLSSTSIALTITAGSLSMESLSVTNGKSYTISNNTGTAANSTLTLGNAATFTNAVSTVANDLIFLSGSSGLVIQGPNGGSGTGVLNLALASSGNFNIGAGSTLNISSVISGAGRSITITNSGTVIFGGANTYSGDTIVNAGDLRFAAGGSSNSSTIRLGNTTGSSSATLSLGNAFGGASGVSLTSPLEVRAGGTGTRVMRSLNTSGTNTFGGAITMNNGLTLEAGTNGTFLFQGGSFDLKTNTLTVDSQNDLNGSDNVNWRGTVQINEVIAGSGGSIAKDGSSTLILQGVNNTYSGGTTIKGGTVGIYGDGSLGLAPSNPTDNVFFAASSFSTATRTLQDTVNDVTLSANRGINIATGVTGTLDSTSHLFTVNGVVAGSGALAVTGTTNGSVVLTGNNTYTGGTTVQSGGTLLANNTAGSATGTGMVTVNNGGTLGGNGTITGPVQVDASGTISPGTTTASGGIATLNTGALTLASNSTFVADLVSTALGSYDQLNVTGGVDITGSNLSLRIGGVLAVNDKFFIVVNDSVDPVLGVFSQGVTVNSGGYTFLIDYADNFGGVGAGNDISLTVTAIPEASTWIGAALALGAIGVTQRKRFAKRFRVIRHGGFVLRRIG
jgi:autotransporter-associated beta strand protein